MIVVDLLLDFRWESLSVGTRARARAAVAAGGFTAASGVRTSVRSSARQGTSAAGRLAPQQQVDVTLRARSYGKSPVGTCIVCLGDAADRSFTGNDPAPADEACDLLVMFEPVGSSLRAELIADPGSDIRPVGCLGRDGRRARGYATRFASVPQTMQFLVSDIARATRPAVVALRLERDMWPS